MPTGEDSASELGSSPGDLGPLGLSLSICQRGENQTDIVEGDILPPSSKNKSSRLMGAF